MTSAKMKLNCASRKVVEIRHEDSEEREGMESARDRGDQVPEAGADE